MNTRRTVLLLFCLLLAGALIQLLTPERRVVAEGEPEIQAEDSPLYLPLVVNQSQVPEVAAAAADAIAQPEHLFHNNTLERAFQDAANGAPGRSITAIH